MDAMTSRVLAASIWLTVGAFFYFGLRGLARAGAIAMVLLVVGCGGASTGMCLPDGVSCTEDVQCCGAADLSDVAPGVRITSTGGTCWAGACATRYGSEGWRCVVVDGAPTCWRQP